MVGPITRMLLRHWPLLGVAGLALGLTVGLAVQTARVSSLRTRLDVAAGDLKTARTGLGDALARLTTCSARRDQLDAALQAQTEAVRAWQSEASRVQRETADQLARAERTAAAHEAAAATLLRGRKPAASPAAACAEADRIILEGVR